MKTTLALLPLLCANTLLTAQIDRDQRRQQDAYVKLEEVRLDPAGSKRWITAEVAFTVATYGINVPGTVYRMDDVPIPLRPAFESPHPSDFKILSGIKKHVKEILHGNLEPTVIRPSLRPQDQ